MPIWFTWKAKENFITCIWYLARRKKITDILVSKSEWMIDYIELFVLFEDTTFVRNCVNEFAQKIYHLIPVMY